MELTFTLKWLPGSVVPIVTTTQDTTSDTPVNVPPPAEDTQTTEKYQRGRDVEYSLHGGCVDREPSVDRWQGEYRELRGHGGNRSWRGGNRSWRGGNRSWRGGNHSWRGGNHSWRGGNRGWSHGDGDERVRHVGGSNRDWTIGGGDRGRDGGAAHRERSAGAGNRDRTVGGVDRRRDGGAAHRERSAGAGNRDRTVGGVDRRRDGGADRRRDGGADRRRDGGADRGRDSGADRGRDGGADRGRDGGADRGRDGGADNSGRHGRKSVSIIALDRVPFVGNVPSTSGCGDGGKATRPFKGQCTKCYEKGHRRKDCPYDVTYRLLTPEADEMSKSTK